MILKRHLLAPDQVIQVKGRENRFSRFTCGRALETIKKTVPKPCISRLRRAPPSGGVKTKIVKFADLTEVIKSARIYIDPSRGYSFTGVGC
jgi:hypothetical protein